MQNVNTRLVSIFRKISEKSTSVDGLMELHRFKKANPHIDIQPYIARSSSQFQVPFYLYVYSSYIHECNRYSKYLQSHKRKKNYTHESVLNFLYFLTMLYLIGIELHY